MGVAKRKKLYPDFFSGAVFLFVVLAIPLTYYYGVARPQDIRKRAYQEDKILLLIHEYKSQTEVINHFDTNDPRFDLDGNGEVNGVDYDLILKNYEGE